MKIPVSLLSTYLYCPRKVFLERVLKLREPPKRPLVLGTIRHEALEGAALAEEGIVLDINSLLSQEEVLNLYQKKYSSLLRDVMQKHSSSLGSLQVDLMDAYEGAFESLMREAKERAMNLHRFMNASKLLGEDLWKGLTPKIRTEVRVESDALRLIGIVDKIEDYGDALVPIELKTGKVPRQGVWPGHRIQAGAYALLLEEAFQKPISTVIVHYLDANEKRVITMNPFMKEEITMLVQEVAEILDNFLLPEFCDAPQKCASCGLKKKCYDKGYMDGIMTSLLS